MILKREIPQFEFPVPRVSEFIPANGKTSIKGSVSKFYEFIDLVFSPEGCYIIEQKATPSETNCKFCPFSNNGICKHSYKINPKQEKKQQWVTLL